MKRFLIILCTLCVAFSLFCVCSSALYAEDPMPMYPYGVIGSADASGIVYGDGIFFLYSRNGVLYEVPSVTWSVRKEVSGSQYDLYYDFVFSGWLPINGSYNDLDICVLLPKYCVGTTSVDTQFSPSGLTASFSYDRGMFALSNEGVSLDLYHYARISRNGTNVVDASLPVGDFWVSGFYLTVSGISSASDQLLLTLRCHVGDLDDSVIYEGEADVEYGTPSFSDLFGGLGQFLSVFWIAFDNRAMLTILIPVAECIVFGILLKLIL